MKYYWHIMAFAFLPFLSMYSQAFLNNIVKEEKSNFERFNKSLNINYPGDSTIDVTYYKLNIALNYDAKYLNGDVTISFKSESSNLTSFFLDLQNTMTVDSVRMNGNRINFAQQAGQAKLEINLPSAMGLNQEESIDVFYGGSPASSDFGSFTFGRDDAGGKTIATLSEPYGASDWWPCKDTPADKADSSDVWMTVENGLTAVSNGKLMEVVDNGNGTHTFKWKNSYPIAQYLISMAIANYIKYNNYYKYSSTDSMLISNYIWQNSYNSSTTYLLDLVPGMMKIFSDRFGPYPFLKEKYGNAQFSFPGGMEHQTITSLGAYSDGVLVHELAHQWFGDKVTCKTWHDVWLNEGFATYCQDIYFEDKDGRQYYNIYINSQMSSAKRDTIHSVYVNDISSFENIFNSATSYAKGAIVLHMLRGIVGDSTFYNILKTYNNDPGFAYNSATTAEFQSIAESVSGLDLNYFFKEWVYGVSYPVYSYNWNYIYTGNDIYQITLNIQQQQRRHPQFFKMPVQINIETNSADTTVTVFNDKLQQQFDISVKGIPLQVTFDPGNLILKDLIVTGIANEKSVPHKFQLEQNYPNPFNPATVINYYIPHITKVKLTITDELGRVVKTLVDKEQTAGQYSVPFNAKDLASGIYFYTLDTEKFSQTKKMIFLK
jgi:aminopeptidase N